MPNKIYVYNKSAVFFILLTTFIILVLSGINPLFYIIYILGLFFALSSFIFAYSYTKILSFKNKIDSVYFQGNIDEAKVIFDFFLVICFPQLKILECSLQEEVFII